jgi:hypothetical protein
MMPMWSDTRVRLFYKSKIKGRGQERRPYMVYNRRFAW